MATAFSLVVLGILSRVLPHPPNAVALGALAIYAGARLPRRWAWAVPVASLLISDLILDFGTDRSAFTFVRATVYATYAGLSLLGLLASRDAGPVRLGALSVGASLIFFATSNFAVWATIGDHPGAYPASFAGLLTCYASALPFLSNSIAADLTGTAALFGGEVLSHRLAAFIRRRAMRSRLAD